MKILAFPYGYSVAHTSRLLEIAKVLREKGHEIIFAGSGNCLKLASDIGFEVRELADVPIERVVEALRTTNFSLLYGNAKEMEHYINEELRLYQAIKPDVILVDDRRTSAASAEIAGLPHVSVVNAHVTNYSAFPLLLPFYQKRVEENYPNSFVQLLHNLQLKVEQTFYNSTLKGIHQAREKLGLRRLFSYQITEGRNLTLIPDIPQFTPLKNPPDNFYYVGPITWQSNLPPTQFLEKFKSFPKKVYFTLGSGGFQEFVNQLKVFEKSPYGILVTAGELMDQLSDCTLPENIFVERYVNADLLLPHCDVVVCHGGNGTLYQALKYGVPVVSVPSHNEQDYGARRTSQLGMGIRLSPKEVMQDFSLILTAIETVLDNPSYKERAIQFSHQLKEWDGAIQSAHLIEKHFGDVI